MAQSTERDGTRVSPPAQFIGSNSSAVKTLIQRSSASFDVFARVPCALRNAMRKPAYIAAVPSPKPTPVRKRASNVDQSGNNIIARPAMPSDRPSHKRQPPRAPNIHAP